ncbi:CobW family GTP-binding protein [Nucisporomicrobium flavum]|uniref:CobW family GTP-binding protein n=1 Tax=Nucisporomicrobium flavum TaxID=2785915 RepID=UPI003C30CDE4
MSARTVTATPRVTVLAGFSAPATDAVARSLLVTDPALLLVRHDISRLREGLVRRTVRTSRAVLEDELVHLVHGCAACTLREDVLPTLVRLAATRPQSDIVLVLPPAVEPEALAAACTQCAVDGVPVTDAVRFDSYVTVVEGSAFLADLTATDDLRHRDLHAAEEDHRCVADVLARQIEYADTLVVWGRPDPTGVAETVLHRLAPWASQVRVGDTAAVDCAGLAERLRRTGRHDPAKPGVLARALEGRPIGVDEPAGEHGVTALVFRARRPFHPQRLHDALDGLTGDTLRGRGQLWLATRPDLAVAWESAGGGIGLGSRGPWLAAQPPAAWNDAGVLRRLTADLDWDPYYGDRRTVLAFIGLALDGPDLTRRLTGCLLTDAELAGGEAAWAGISDPFADFFPVDSEEVRP